MRKLTVFQVFFMLAMVGFIVGVPELARADYAQPPWDAALQTLVNSMTGSTAHLISILAVAGLGILAMGGRISIHAALSVVLGIAIVFGAATIVNMFVK